MRNTTTEKKYEILQKDTAYVFKDKGLLQASLYHSSYANEKSQPGIVSNERLEFLGDAILNMVVSNHIYTRYPDMPEGELTRLRASVVCEPTLVLCARKINLGNYILLGKSEEMTGGRERPSILSDAFEALIGAIYLDGGLEVAGKFILALLTPHINPKMTSNQYTDYKTMLQEKMQKGGECKITYEIINESGPDHLKTFTAQVILRDKAMGTGNGRNKKEAEQLAARETLNMLEKGNII